MVWTINVTTKAHKNYSYEVYSQAFADRQIVWHFRQPTTKRVTVEMGRI